MNKKIITIAIIGILLLAGVTAIITLENGDKIIESSELSQITDNQIANYMNNSLQITRHKLLNKKIIVYYNITYLEPMHVNNSYRVFTQEKPFFISIELWKKCLNKTTKSTCKNLLVDRQNPYYLIENITRERELENGTIITEYKETNTTIKSTYLQAIEEQTKQYDRAIVFRDKAINNELSELSDLI